MADNSAYDDGEQQRRPDDASRHQHQEETESIYPQELTIRLQGNTRSSVFLIAVASFVELWSAIAACRDEGDWGGMNGYSVGVGTVSLALTAIHIILTVNRSSFAAAVNSPMAGFLLLWWLVGASLLTFLGPFKAIANGFFASWFALLSTINLAYHCLTPLQTLLQTIQERSRSEALETRLLLLLVLSSGVELAAACVTCAGSIKNCDTDVRWGVAAGGASVILSFILLVTRKRTPHSQMWYLSCFLALWWVVSTGVLTFGDTFAEAGNGYFACWVCCLSAVHLAYLDLLPDSLTN